MILRRTDAWFCDPLELRADSRLGVPGLVEVARLGGVSIVNTLGSGVLENPGLLPYLPRLAQHLLGEQLVCCRRSPPGGAATRTAAATSLPTSSGWWSSPLPGAAAQRRCSRGSSRTSGGTTCGAGSKLTQQAGSARSTSSCASTPTLTATVSRPGRACFAPSPWPARAPTLPCPAA